jgi:hypothetical protein
MLHASCNPPGENLMLPPLSTTRRELLIMPAYTHPGESY